MKKTFIIASILSFSFASFVNAQDSPRETVTFGVKAGFNYSNVWDEKGQDFEADGRFGFAGGAFIGVPFGELFGFQPELMLSQKGFQGSGTMFAMPYSFTKTTTWLDIPLQFQVKPSDYITLLVGPQFSYLLHEKNVYTWGSSSSAQEEEFENDDVRKNMMGFVTGIDINVSHFVVSGRVSWDFQRNNGDGTTTTPRYKNQLVQFTLGYKL